MTAAGGKGGDVASDALQAIVRGTMAQFDTKTRTSDGFARNGISPTFNGNSTDVFYDDSGDSYSRSSFTTFPGAGDIHSLSSYSDVAGTMLHEMTHGIDHNVFENTLTLGVDKNASEEELKKIMMHRQQVLNALGAIGGEKGVDQASANLINNRIEYGGGGRQSVGTVFPESIRQTEEGTGRSGYPGQKGPAPGGSGPDGEILRHAVRRPGPE